MPRAAYIHVPFCARRCGYCNFTLVAGRGDLVNDFLHAIEIELQTLKEPREVETLFIGGGTPTFLSPEQLERFLSTLATWFPLAKGHEFSIEANPADVNVDRVAVLAAHGVNRISLGAQSFRDQKLRLLERDHSGDDVRRAFYLCRPFRSVGLDLIFSAPEETLAEWEADVRTALELQPDHISTYGLTIEKGTTFFGRWTRGSLVKPAEELERSMYATAIERITSAGFEHYEVSNFAKSYHRCRHNETYWLGGEYFAAGPGAARNVGGRREVNHRSTTTYLQRVLNGQSPVAESEELSPTDRARELFVFAMRRMEGVRRDWFSERTMFNLDKLLGRPLRKFVEMGLIFDDQTTVKLTAEGLFVSDALWPEFLDGD